MTPEELKTLTDQVGAQAAAKIKSEMEAYEAKSKATIEALAEQKGYLTKEQYEAQTKAANDAIAEIKGIAEKQGTTINDLFSKLDSGNGGSVKSIEQILKEDEAELKNMHGNRYGVKEYIIMTNSKGEVTMHPIRTKAAGPTATIDGVGGGGNTASIAQSLNAATLLRVGGNSPIVSQYRNTPWVFDLCNLITAGYNEGSSFAMWFEEVEKQGSSATVAEGGTKPTVQYAYELKSDNYKKESALVSFTDEFALDFPRLQSDILGKGLTDLKNRMNTAILTRIKAAATAYSTSASFNGGTPMTDVNEFDVIAAMAAQVDSSTYGSMANSAIMSTFKKYRMGTLKSTNGEYLNTPDVISNLNLVGNPDLGADDVIVGDLSQYNIILRGGTIVRVGYNGNDIAEGKFSVVMDQFYFDYISNIRKKAIVKGSSFADVKAALES